MRNLCAAIVYFHLQFNVNMASLSTKTSNSALYRKEPASYSSKFWKYFGFDVKDDKKMKTKQKWRFCYTFIIHLLSNYVLLYYQVNHESIRRSQVEDRDSNRIAFCQAIHSPSKWLVMPPPCVGVGNVGITLSHLSIHMTISPGTIGTSLLFSFLHMLLKFLLQLYKRNIILWLGNWIKNCYVYTKLKRKFHALFSWCYSPYFYIVGPLVSIDAFSPT